MGLIPVATVRRNIRIHRPAAQVWALVGNPTTLHEWFPGISHCEVVGNIRTITLDSGIPLPEEIVTVDSVDRRFQYQITGGLLRLHLGT
ncbi:MAG: SRPBCC family protein, partial [Actinomycetes bacterium]